MAEQVVGYRVVVYGMPNYEPNAAVLYEQEFRERAEDSPGYRLGNALARAERNAQHMERTFPGRYVEVDCIWEEV